MTHTAEQGQDFEQCLDWIRARAANRREGLFGPKSAMWLVMREMAAPFGAIGAVLLQVAHPAIAAAGAHGSRFQGDFRGRTQRTFNAMYEIIFGDLDSAMKTIERIHHIHARVKGEAKDGSGQRYSGTDPDLLFWVLATLIDSSVKMYDLVIRPLSSRDREDYYQDMKTFGVAMGIPPGFMPEDWTAFETYFEGMVNGEKLRIGPTGRRIADFIRHSAAAKYTSTAALAAGLMPPRWREAYGLPWGKWDVFRFERTIAAMRFAIHRMPLSMRFCPAYHQALVRTAGAPKESKTLVTRAVTWSCGLLNLPFVLPAQAA